MELFQVVPPVMRWWHLLKAFGCVRDTIRPGGSSSSLAELDRQPFSEIEAPAADEPTEEINWQSNDSVEAIQAGLFRLPSGTGAEHLTQGYAHVDRRDTADLKYMQVRSNPELINELGDLLYPGELLYELPIWKVDERFTADFIASVRGYQSMRTKAPFPIPANPESLLAFLAYGCNDSQLIMLLLHLVKAEPTLLGGFKGDLPLEAFDRFVRNLHTPTAVENELFYSLVQPAVSEYSICDLTVREVFLLPLLARMLSYSFRADDIRECLQLAGFLDFRFLHHFYVNQFYGPTTARLVWIILTMAQAEGYSIHCEESISRYDD